MFIVMLKFSENKSQSGEHMAGHNEWLESGFADGVFLMAGSLEPGLGGGILAHNTDREALQDRVSRDPFVAQDIVAAEIVEMTPKRVHERLQFMLE